MALKMNGEAPFEPAGKGCFICFNLADIAELEEKYGVGEYLQTIDANLQEGSGGTTLDCLRIGLKHRVDEKRVRVDLDPDDIQFAITQAHEPIMDALCLAVSNMTYTEMLEEVAKKQAEMEAAFQKISDESTDEQGPLADSGVPGDTKPSDIEQD